MLECLGAKNGDRMIILLPRVPAWWEIVCGAIRMVVAVCPCTILLANKDIEYRIYVSGASIFVGDKVSVKKFMRIKDQSPTCKTVLQVSRVVSP